MKEIIKHWLFGEELWERGVFLSACPSSWILFTKMAWDVTSGDSTRACSIAHTHTKTHLDKCRKGRLPASGRRSKHCLQMAIQVNKKDRGKIHNRLNCLNIYCLFVCDGWEKNPGAFVDQNGRNRPEATKFNQDLIIKSFSCPFNDLHW